MGQNKLSVRDLCLISLFAAITAVLAQIAIPIPISPVPISFGMVAIYLSGMLLSPRSAALSQLVYLLLGAVGVPVFHNFKGGLGILFGSTGGYLFMYPLMALIIANYFRLYRQKFGHQPRSISYIAGAALALFLALCLEYAGGTLWLCYLLDIPLSKGLALGVYPYVPLDLLKIAACVAAFLPLRERLAAQQLLKEEK